MEIVKTNQNDIFHRPLLSKNRNSRYEKERETEYAIGKSPVTSYFCINDLLQDKNRRKYRQELNYFKRFF